MSNPLETLRRLVSPIKSTQGVVVEISGGLVKLATPNGLVEAPDTGNIIPGQAVTAHPDGRVTASKAEYWV